jgi:hypothetical protein
MFAVHQGPRTAHPGSPVGAVLRQCAGTKCDKGDR